MVCEKNIFDDSNTKRQLIQSSEKGLVDFLFVGLNKKEGEDSDKRLCFFERYPFLIFIPKK